MRLRTSARTRSHPAAADPHRDYLSVSEILSGPLAPRWILLFAAIGVKDAEWIADLVCRGLIAKSFVPPHPPRELRDLLRYRRKLIESQASEPNRPLRLLETKLAGVASDVFGVSGHAQEPNRGHCLSRGHDCSRNGQSARQA